MPNAEGAEPNAEVVFDEATSREPNEKAEDGIDPNGDAPNDEAGFPKDCVLPNVDGPDAPPKAVDDPDPLLNVDG